MVNLRDEYLPCVYINIGSLEPANVIILNVRSFGFMACGQSW